MRRTTARVLLVVAGGAAVAMIAGSGSVSAARGGPRSAMCEGSCGRTAQSSAAEQLAERYAPVVYLKDQTSECDHDGEAFPPVGVEAVLGNPSVVLRTSADDAGTDAPLARDLFAKGEPYYLDLPGSPTDPGCTYERDFKALDGALPRVAYAHIATEPGRRGIALQYWFYYYFNDWNNKHESDWEMIQLFFDATSVEDALTMAPDHTGYSQHSAAEYAGWDSDKLQREGDHPVVYVAAGSHSNQYAAGKYLGRAEQNRGFGCDDATGPLTRTALTARLVPERVTSADDPYAWITYTGSWGARARGEFDGPTGPNTTTQWLKPMTWEDTRLRRSNVKVPSGKTAGINPSAAFCGIVSFASIRLLPVVAAAPWAIPAVGFALAGGIFVTIRNTDFGLVTEPLRRRRRFGQILRTSLVMYRRNPGLMLGIALAFIPAGAIASLLQTLVFRFSMVGAVLSVTAAPRLVEIALGMALGAAVFGGAYIVVVIGVIAAIREIEAGRAVSASRAYRAALTRARDLAVARGRAVAIVALLAVSIVGIPWAITRAVSWLFIEHAIILDDADQRDAAGISERAVRGDWWRTGVIAGLLLGAGVAASLLVAAPILLLATQVPLDTVNAISSMIYIALSPLVGIALTLLYFDVAAEDAVDGVG